MKAAVFHKINDIRYEHAEDPKIEESRDAIIRVTSTAICGSDLHIYDGVFPQLRPMTLGHEFMGIIEETGNGPPSMMLTAEAANSNMEALPNRRNAPKSTLSVNKTKLAGSRYRDTMGYRPVLAPSTMPLVLSSEGRK